MSSTFCDTQGNKFVIESVLDSEGDCYASLFSAAVTFRARHVKTNGDNAGATATAVVAGGSPAPSQAPQRQGMSFFPRSTKTTALSDTVMVTYVPLLSSIQGIVPSKEVASLLALQDYVCLRRQVEHPFLRSLFDVFYTQQSLAAPVCGAAAAAVVRRPVEVNSPTAKRAHKATSTMLSSGEESGAPGSKGSDAADRDNATSNASSLSSSDNTFATSGTALVLIEEFIEGCTLANYVDAVARKRLLPSNAKLQRDAAAIAYQLAQLLHYLHTTGHVLCREIPLGNITLDQNKGFISVRLPLSAAHLLHQPGERCLPHVVSTLMSEASWWNREIESCWTEESLPLRAPELRHVAYWDATWDPVTCNNETNAAVTTGCDAVSFGAADIWTLGTITTLLCSLNHKQFVQTTRAERLSLVSTQAPHLTDLLPADTQEGILHLVRSCLEATPAKRPTAAEVLRSNAFVMNRSHTVLEQNRAVISIAEAVANANRRKMPPASLQLAESTAAAAGAARNVVGIARATTTTAAVSDNALATLSLQDTEWNVMPRYRDVFLPQAGGAPSLEEPTMLHTAQVLRHVSPSLCQATQDASQDLERLFAQYVRLYPNDPAMDAPLGAPEVGVDGRHNALRKRLRRGWQMPRDLLATKHVFEELMEQFSHLQSTNPEVSFRFVELLLEGLSSCPQDVAAVQESVTLADTLLHMAWTPNPAEDAGERLGTFEESMLSSTAEVDQRDFQVADVLRSMPTMPERMIVSDRAANTSAVLYNQWLRKEKKRFVRFEGY